MTVSITQGLLSYRKTPINALFLSCKNCHTEKLPSVHCFDLAGTAVIQKTYHQCTVSIMQELLSYRKPPIGALFRSCKNYCHTLLFYRKTPISALPKGRLGMSDVTLLPGIAGLSFDSPFLSPLSSFCLILLLFPSFFSTNGPF